jgi:hypothetical protein
MNPGPIEFEPRVLKAFAAEGISHVDKSVIEVFGQCLEKMRKVGGALLRRRGSGGARGRLTLRLSPFCCDRDRSSSRRTDSRCWWPARALSDGTWSAPTWSTPATTCSSSTTVSAADTTPTRSDLYLMWVSYDLHMRWHGE